MKNQLHALLLAVLGAATPAALAQSPWVSVIPPWNTGGFNTQTVTMMQLTGPGNISVLVEGSTSNGIGSYSVMHTSTDNGQIWSSTSLAGRQGSSTGTALRDYSPLDG